MRIAVLTGGGDVPGLNPCIKAITESALHEGWDVVGFRRGWAGPLGYNPDDPDDGARHLLPLTHEAVRTIDRTGGTILHSSRTNPAKVKSSDLPDFLGNLPRKGERVDATPHVLKVLDSLKIDALVALGGDDTLSYAARLHQEGFAVMACPKTMDNDVFGTDYCMGFSTAVSRSVEAINALRTPTGSHERIGVVELFGRNSGETALLSGYLADADRTLIAEVPFEMEKLAALLKKDHARNPSRYAMLVLSEGAQMKEGAIVETGPEDAYGHRKLGGIGEMVGAEIQRLTGIGVMNQKLAYLMRGGPPDALDQMVARNYGTMAVQLLKDGKRGLMTAIQAGRYTSVPVDTCIKGTRRVDVPAFYDVEAYRPRIAQIAGKPMFLY
ncbi:MAG TPA: ATP-dependent 6-phosphofructokinase [Rhizomicrobium sp.]|nr:ATP-dependent 6-phosphofructokinase [Rhizomicrobium sp.]